MQSVYSVFYCISVITMAALRQAGMQNPQDIAERCARSMLAGRWPSLASTCPAASRHATVVQARVEMMALLLFTLESIEIVARMA